MVKDINEILENYELDVIKKIDRNNLHEIIRFLQLKNVDYIDDILEDYLDLFLIPCSEFRNKFNDLNKKYNGNLVLEVRNDLSILEQFIY